MDTADERFMRAVAKVLAHEGGYVNDPDDPGGETKYGISKRAYPRLDIRSLTREDAVAIYYRDFWAGPRIAQLRDERLAAKVFDLAVNVGRGRAIRMLQSAAVSLGTPLAVDEIIGPVTLAVINSHRHPKALLCALILEAGQYYRSLAKPKYLAGRLNRLIDL